MTDQLSNPSPVVPEATDAKRRAAPPRGGRLLIAGYLGAGKSHLIRSLTGTDTDTDTVQTAERFADRPAGEIVLDGIPFAISEMSALRTPDPAHPGSADDPALIITVVDAVNTPALLSDPDIAPLLTSQIQIADAIWLTRSDLGDGDVAQSMVQKITNAPVLRADQIPASVETIFGLFSGGNTGSIRRRDGAQLLDQSDAFTIWRHQGASVLTAATLDALLADRPKGAYRITGQVAGPEGGHMVDVFGRARQMAPMETCESTDLWVCGLSDRFSRRDMDLAFTEAVLASSYNRGLIACR